MFRLRVMPLGGRIKSTHAVIFFCAAITMLLMLRLRGGGHRRPAFTEGRTAPWREWDKKTAPDDEAGYLRDLVHRHGLTPEVNYFSRRIRPHYGRGASAAAAGAKPPPSMTDATAKLAPRGGFGHPRLDDPDLTLGRDRKPVSLSLARSPTPDMVDGSSLLFGIATTHARVSYANYSALNDWQRWLTDGKGNGNGAALVLILHGASDTEVTRVGEKLRAFGVDATVSAPAKKKDGGGGGNARTSVGARYAELLGVLNERNNVLAAHPVEQQQQQQRQPPTADTENKRDGGDEKKQDGEGVDQKKEKRNNENETTKRGKRIVALVDDDTFFPSMAWLTRRLSRFSLDGEWYIGAPSDRQGDWAVLSSGRAMTYGGGAVFFSPSVASRVSSLACTTSMLQDKDAHDPSSTGGDDATVADISWDERLFRCVEAETDHRLHVLPSLYAPPATEDGDGGLYSEQKQQKISIDDVGYGSGQQALALHHYRNYHQFDAGRGHEVASACGEACFLQRFHFPDGWVLVNGCSLSHYPDGMEIKPLRPQQKDNSSKSKGSKDGDGGSESERGRGKKKNKNPVVDVPLADERLVMEIGEEASPADGGGDDDAGAGGSSSSSSSSSGKKPPSPSDLLLREAKVVAWRGRRQTWRLLDSLMVPGTGEVWQAYVKRHGFKPPPWAPKGDAPKPDGVHEDAEPEPVDSIVVLIWEGE